MQVSQYFGHPVISSFKTEAERLSNMKVIQPEYAQIQHPETEFTLVYLSLHFNLYFSPYVATCDLVIVLCEFNTIAKIHELYHTIRKLFTLIIHRINYFLKSCNADAKSKCRNYIQNYTHA
jgi:hypothetical protein